MTRILIIGGYGNFGSYISKRLATEKDLTIIIAGRDGTKAALMAKDIGAEWAELDISENFSLHLSNIKPDIVIHTSGPFQGQGYAVAKACIAQKCHYIDLADGRDFVSNIGQLDAESRAAGIIVISGCSSVPALTSAIIDEYMPHFGVMDTVSYGISTAQKTNRGLATTKSVLSYAGKPFQTFVNGISQKIYGWQNIHIRKFDGLGWRFLGNCDIPDLTLFPTRYPTLKTIHFYAGLEIPFIHIGLWVMTWLVRLGIISDLAKFSALFLKLSFFMDIFGTDNSGFYMEMRGTNKLGSPKRINFDLLAKNGDGPLIPCTPAIAVALKLARGTLQTKGAYPCVGVLSLDDILQELRPLDISWTTKD